MIEEFPLLFQLFDEVIVPHGVYQEVMDGTQPFGKTELRQAVDQGIMTLYRIQNAPFVQKLLGRLHQGELEAIIAAKELDANFTILDDLLARQLAGTFLIPVLGTVGVLRLAKQKKLISDVKSRLDGLLECGFRIGSPLYERVLRELGEM